MTIDEIRQTLRAAGAGPGHERRVLQAWLSGLPLDARTTPDRAFSRGLRRILPELELRLRTLGTVDSEHRAGDGSVRLLVRLADGQTVESVLLPRDGVCVSTQVGCAVGCLFCATGLHGLSRHLDGAEIAAQVAMARSRQTVRRVVFMGMGEPAHNLDPVLSAIDLLGTEGGFGHKNLVFSTVGDHRVFQRLPAGRVRPALALSLHTTCPDLRARLLPRAPRIHPRELVLHANEYARATGHPIQYQWTLLEGVNDSDAELERLAGWLAGHYAVVNFIPYNPGAGDTFRRPSIERVTAMARYLSRRGVLAKVRQSAGQDVQAGCGQLRSRRLQAATGMTAVSVSPSK